MRSALAKCGLTTKHIESQVRVLSGGEQAKVRLCKLLNRDTNFLLLDEPTNHLDVDAKDSLKQALQEYKSDQRNYREEKRTSRRVKGKKYPQPVDTYIGVITPEGVIQSNKRKVSLTDAEVWEYGFSKAVWELCPDDWKKPLGDDWQDVLSIILLKQSPTSYIQKTRVMKKESDFRYQFAAQTASLSRRIYKKQGIGLEELHQLETIYLVCLDKTEIISKVNEGQRRLLEKIQVALEMC